MFKSQNDFARIPSKISINDVFQNSSNNFLRDACTVYTRFQPRIENIPRNNSRDCSYDFFRKFSRILFRKFLNEVLNEYWKNPEIVANINHIVVSDEISNKFLETLARLLEKLSSSKKNFCGKTKKLWTGLGRVLTTSCSVGLFVVNKVLSRFY